jgi:hypothetical protein
MSALASGFTSLRGRAENRATGAHSQRHSGAPADLSAVGGALSNPGGLYTDPGGATSVPSLPNNRSVGTTVTGSVQVIDGLNVQAQIYFSPVKAVMRSVLFLTNPSGAPITVNVENATDQGAGSNTFVQATSSGDNPFNYVNDHWIVISNGASPPNSGTPVTTYALGEAPAGPGDGD